MKEYNLTFTIEDLKILDECLSNGVFKVVAPLVDKINKQIAENEKTEK